jgi:hypothetical protein
MYPCGCAPNAYGRVVPSGKVSVDDTSLQVPTNWDFGSRSAAFAVLRVAVCAPSNTAVETINTATLRVEIIVREY